MKLSFHSYKGGTGKTNLVGNAATYLANKGYKVCMIDIDLAGPGLQSLFNLKPNKTLTDYFTKKCSEKDMLYYIGNKELYLIPSSATEEDMISFFTSPAKAKEKILQFIAYLEDECHFDHILFDCSAGILKSSLLIMNVADFAIIVSTLDKQDINGTYVISGIARKLNCKPHVLFNRIPENKIKEMTSIIRDFGETLGFDVLELMAYNEDMANTWSRKILMDSNPDSTYCIQVSKLLGSIVN